MVMDVIDMKNQSFRLLVGLTVIVFFVWVFLSTSSRPRIMILQSLSESADWSSRIDVGIKEELRKNRRPVAVSYHYMNLEDKQTEQQFRIAIASAKRSIEQIKPDILISIDDESNALVTSKLNVETRPAIVYTGVIQNPKIYGYGPDTRATGVQEDIQIRAILDSIKELKPNSSLNIAVVGIDDLTGQAEMEIIKAANWSPHKLESIALVDDFAAWQSFIVDRASKADILIVLTTDLLKKDKGGGLVPENELVAWTEAHSIPLPIGIRHSFVRYGGGLAITIPGSVFGRRAIEMSFKWLNAGLGTRPPEPVKPQEFDVALRRTVLERRGVSLPEIYQELARSSGSLYP